MKRILGATLILVMFSVILLGGISCDDFDCQAGNYITVVVSASIHAEVTSSFRTEPWVGAQLEVEINKSGGERSRYNRTTDAYGNAVEQCQRTFKVYKEQYVHVAIQPVSGVFPASMGGEAYDSTRHMWSRCSLRLYWNELDEYGWGDTYFWSPNVTLTMNIDW